MGRNLALDGDIEVAGLRDVLHERDLESQDDKKMTGVTITELDNTPTRPVLGRRKTTGSLNGVGGVPAPEAIHYEGEEDVLTKIGNFVWKIHSASIITRYALYILPVAAILAIPLVVTATVYQNVRIDGVRVLGLFIWIEIIWFALWVCKLVAQVFPIIFQAACGLISTGIRKYSLVLKALEIPLSLFLWTIVGFATSKPTLCVFDQGLQGCGRPNSDGTFGPQWIQIVGQVWKAGIVVAAIFLIQKTIMQLISINYHRKQFDQKIRGSKKLIRILDLMYDASRKLFPEFCPDFEADDGEIQSSTLTSVRTKFGNSGVGTKVVADMHRVRDKVTAAFGAMASDVTGKNLFGTTNAHSIVIKALETEGASKALARRLWLSFAASGHDSLYKQDLVEVLGAGHSDLAEEIFHMLDRDGNGDVSLEEMTMLIVNTATERKDRASSMHDISQAIAVLDKLLSVVVLLAIAFIYATFFSKAFANKTAQLWTSFTGLAFAIGGTVTEFLACCIFLFVKHPYDVGDRVTIDKQELIVKHISLMYSVFRRVDNGGTVQIPHNVANALWIENVTRSRQMKERLTFSVAINTSMEDILTLRSELHKFVTADENRRDFQPDFDIELLSIGDMKSLELRIEIRHKSNWSLEAQRSSRRNKFMVHLLQTMRRVPIDPPGGSSAPLGDPANPSYSVSLTDLEAIRARADKAAAVEAKRMYPTGTPMDELAPEAGEAGFLTPAMAMYPGLTSRSRGLQLHQEAVGRRSSEFQGPSGGDNKGSVV